MSRERRRVAITGIGVVAAAGQNAEAFWAGLLAPAPVGAREIEEWDPEPYFANPKETRRADRVAQFALGAADQAMRMAGDPDSDPTRKAVVIATGIGGLNTLETQIQTFYTKGPRRVSPFLVPMMMPNAAAAAASMKYGYQGPCETPVTACAAGTHALSRAAELIMWGRADTVLTGGTESSLTPTGIQGFQNMTALSSDGVSQPFSVDRNGFAIAEGAAVLLFEEWEQATARGAIILGEFLGSGSNADAHHITAPSPGGIGAANCIKLALDDAGLSPSDIGHVNAHGTSTPLNDAAEADAIHRVFGDNGVPVTSTKGVTGHALGAAGAIEAVAAVLSMQNRLIPPTAGTKVIDPAMPPIDLVLVEPRPWEPAPVLSNSFGFGGHNGCLIIGPA
jgi:3-oxoacyl-[acyl-carrier-protein] synthase II